MTPLAERFPWMARLSLWAAHHEQYGQPVASTADMPGEPTERVKWRRAEAELHELCHAVLLGNAELNEVVIGKRIGRLRSRTQDEHERVTIAVECAVLRALDVLDVYGLDHLCEQSLEGTTLWAVACENEAATQMQVADEWYAGVERLMADEGVRAIADEIVRVLTEEVSDDDNARAA